VNQEHSTRLEPNDQILPAAIERLDALPDELGGDLSGIEGAGEARIGDLYLVEGAADQVRLEADPDRLDLGQLGHGRSVAARRWA
jgi:hypothetical protein